MKNFIARSLYAHYGVVDDEDLSISTAIFSAIVTLYCAGGSIGAYMSGPISNKFGRKRAVLLTLIMTLLGSCIGTVSKMFNAFELLLVGRFLIGIGAGACFSCVPLYVCEIAPGRYRGALGASSQLFITIGIFTASFFTLERFLGGPLLWPVGFGAQSFFCMISAIILLLVAEESPKWILTINKDAAQCRV